MEIKGQGVEALFLYASEGILIINEQEVIIHANPSTEKLYGYGKNELTGQQIEILVPKRLEHQLEYERNVSKENPNARSMGAELNLYGLRKDGSEFPVEICLSPYAVKEEKFVVVFIMDVTQKKQAEEKAKQYSDELEKRAIVLEEAIHELEQTKLELNKSLEKERELNELKSRFVSMASHEFRTPLTTMMSSLSLVTKYTQQNDTNMQGKHIGKIKNSIHNMTDILNDFLSVSKIEEGKVQSTPQKGNLKLFLKEIISEMSLLAKPNQQIELVYDGNERVFMDTKLLKNILLNLISNAIKFSPESALIKIKSQIINCSFKISVEDEGIGIPKKDQKHLFERFFRGKNTSNIQGTGLGLYIVRNYIDLMNGSMDYVSDENKGTRFTITIPQ